MHVVRGWGHEASKAHVCTSKGATDVDMCVREDCTAVKEHEGSPAGTVGDQIRPVLGVVRYSCDGDESLRKAREPSSSFSSA